MKSFGRIIACGMISQYNLPYDQMYKIGNVREFVSRRLKMQGFIVSGYHLSPKSSSTVPPRAKLKHTSYQVSDENMGPVYAEEHQKNVQQWMHDGTFKATLHVTRGVDNAGEALLELFAGKNFGKAVLQISEL